MDNGVAFWMSAALSGILISFPSFVSNKYFLVVGNICLMFSAYYAGVAFGVRP